MERVVTLTTSLADFLAAHGYPPDSRAGRIAWRKACAEDWARVRDIPVPSEYPDKDSYETALRAYRQQEK